MKSEYRRKSEYRIFQGRLALFKSSWDNSLKDWENHWSNQSIERLLKSHADGFLGEYEIITRYISTNLPVLEAGCGMGQIVLALTKRGYSIEGVDYAEHTIRNTLELLPELNVRVGDVYHLDAADGNYGGYISLGVLEHNPDGPLDGLREARRVLDSRGFAFFSVPYLNSKRKKLLRKATNAEDVKMCNGFYFYQYYYSEAEFTSFLHKAGFEVIEVSPLDVYWGLVYDYAFWGWLCSRSFFHWRAHNLFRLWCLEAPMVLRRRISHMIMFVCKPI